MKDYSKYDTSKCDRFDYLIATGCGTVAGLIDSFFVGDPLSSKLGKGIDNISDEFVKKAAKFFWNNDTRSLGRPKNSPESLEQCISYLEQAFPVNYDARYSADLNVVDGQLSGLRPSNHHLMSLSHSPDLIGLIFSIIDQLSGCATFVDNGKIIRVVPKKTSGAIPYLQGSNLISMLFCGFVNWVGHLLSDFVGSSSTRKTGKKNRGSGIAIPFYEMFLLCDFGNFDGNTLAKSMIQVFEKGYDARFAITMSIPVIINDLLIKVLWMVRRLFQFKMPIADCIPNETHQSLRVMLLIGNGILCVIDGVDAVMRSKGNFVNFCLHINIIAWYRMIKLAFREICIRNKLGMEYLNYQFTLINSMLDDHLKSLEQIDIEGMEREIEDFKSINLDLNELSSNKEIADYLYATIRSRNLDLPFSNHNEFVEFMNNDDDLII